jgi:hypothetical protein
MFVDVRACLWRVGLAGCVAVGLGCDTGGLLVVDGTRTNTNFNEPAPHPQTNEMVSGGTLAKNRKYKLIYTLGQPTPNQGAGTSPGHRDQGGLIGAAQND